MSKRLYFIILISAVVLAVGASVFYYYLYKPEACIKGRCFKVEVASTQQAEETGLMYRKSLPQDHGMLFVFDTEDVHPFWMKNTYIPLDMIFINGRGEVVEVEENAPPCLGEFCPTYGRKAQSKYVLEINGGLSSEIGISVGDKVEIR